MVNLSDNLVAESARELINERPAHSLCGRLMPITLLVVGFEDRVGPRGDTYRAYVSVPSLSSIHDLSLLVRNRITGLMS